MPSVAATPTSSSELVPPVDAAARLRQCAQEFASNLLSATRDFAWHVTLETELAGLSERDLERAQRTAQAAGVEGFLLTLDAHCLLPALASLEDRALRKTLYEAYYTRASDRGPRAGRFDNTGILSEMLELRYQLARQSGLPNYAALALRDGVITEPDAAENALLRSHRKTRARAQAELDTLWAFAKEKGVPRGFSNWDLPYYLALWQRERLGFDVRTLRDYFELQASVQGALGVAKRCLGLTIDEGTRDAGSRTLRYSLAEGAEQLGVIELDPFGPAAALGEETVTPLGHAPGGVPSVRIECGFETPCDDTAAVLLEHVEAERLFRCVGRAVFLLRTRAMQAGEAPSRQALLGSRVAGYFFERLANHAPTLATFARHRETGAPLGPELAAALAQSRLAHAALDASSDLEMELFDLRVHRDHIPAAKATQLRVQVLDTFTQVRREQSVLPASYWTRLANISVPLFVQDEAARLWERSWAREMATSLFTRLVPEGGLADAEQRAWETFWAPSQQGVQERLARTLGDAPVFGALS